jgi:hypothetical protein
MNEANSLNGAWVLMVEADGPELLESSRTRDLLDGLKSADAGIIGPVLGLRNTARITLDGMCDAAILNVQDGSPELASVSHLLLSQNIPFIVLADFRDRALPVSPWAGCRIMSTQASVAEIVGTIAILVRWSRFVKGTPMRSGAVAEKRGARSNLS